jgi:hypothetical protein
MGGKFGQALAAPFDERGPHRFGQDNVCIHCKQNKSQLGNLFNCSGNHKKSRHIGFSMKL